MRQFESNEDGLYTVAYRKLNYGTIMDEDKIFGCLWISYDVLQQHHQEMFLDIACVSLGQSKDFALWLWKSHGWFPPSGVQSLAEKALVTVDKHGRFCVHDHLRYMGSEIVRKKRIHEGAIRCLWMLKSLILLKGNEVCFPIYNPICLQNFLPLVFSSIAIYLFMGHVAIKIVPPSNPLFKYF